MINWMGAFSLGALAYLFVAYPHIGKPKQRKRIHTHDWIFNIWGKDYAKILSSFSKFEYESISILKECMPKRHDLIHKRMQFAADVSHVERALRGVEPLDSTRAKRVNEMIVEKMDTRKVSVNSAFARELRRKKVTLKKLKQVTGN